MHPTPCPSRLAGPGALVIALVSAAVLVLAAPGTARADDNGGWFQRMGGSRVSGSGHLQSDTRSVGSFQAISLKSSVKLVLRQGSRESVEVRADDNILPLIETRVVDAGGVQTLEVRTRAGASYSTQTTPIVTVDLIKLTGLGVSGSGDISGEALKSPTLKVAVSGAGDIRLNKLDVDDLGVKVSGSGDIRFDGRAGKLAVSIAGSGDVDTAGLQADDVSVNIAGSGDASVNARKTLAVSIAGSGDVVYRGDAVARTSIAGSGTVTKK